MKNKWNKDLCIEMAKHCKSRSDFKKRYSGAWDFAFDNNILKEVYEYLENPNKLSLKWTKNGCKLICNKYSIYSEFIKNEPKVYDVLLRRKWLDECCNHMLKSRKKNGYWTKENCLLEGKKYKTKKDWSKYSYKSYCAAHRYGWINICSQHMEKLSSSYERVIYSFEFNDNHVYVGLTYSPKNRKKNHLTNEKSIVFKHIFKTNKTPLFKILTNSLKKEDASMVEGEILRKYKKNGWNILNRIKTGGLGGSILKWTKENCLKEAKKHKYRCEFKYNSIGAYNSARKNEWLNECCNHMNYKQLPNGFWKNNKNRCLEEAKKYSKMCHFKINSAGAYNAVVGNKWYDEFKLIYKKRKIL